MEVEILNLEMKYGLLIFEEIGEFIKDWKYCLIIIDDLFY